MSCSYARAALVALLVLGNCSWARAADKLDQNKLDNVLGLPAPRDPDRPGAVVLHGGGPLGQDVFDRFLQLAGGAEARIVLVPSAGHRPTDYASNAEFVAAMKYRFSGWVSLATERKIASFQFLYTDDPADADNPVFVKSLESATGVWFSGGAQSRLNYRYVGPYPQQTRFQSALREVVERGGVVGGTSAGMAAMPEIMTVTHDRVTLDGPATAVTAHGLGLLTGAIVEQHFDGRGGRMERFTGLLRDSDQLDQLARRKNVGIQMVGLAAEERTALVASGDRLEAIGNGYGHVFLKSPSGRTITWHELRSGESVQIKRSRPDLAVVQWEEADGQLSLSQSGER
jgi:cyanophycinase